MALFAALTSIFPIFAIIAIGYFLRCRGIATKEFADGIAQILVNVAMPCAIIVSVTKFMTPASVQQLSYDMVCLGLIMFLWYAACYIWAHLTHMRPGRVGAFLAGIANTNTLFIGWPLNEAIFGDEAMPYYLAYLLVCNISTWTIGYLCILRDPSVPDGEKGGLSHFDIRRLFPPPVIGFCLGLVLMLGEIPLPAVLVTTMSYLGALVTPLSLLFIGISLANAGIRHIRPSLDNVSAVLARLVVAPLMALGILIVWQRYFGPMDALEWQTYVVQSATPIMAVLPILVHTGKGDVLYATDVVTLTTFLFIVTIPIIIILLGA